MKKIISLLMIMALLSGLMAGCGTQAEPAQEPDVPQSAPETVTSGETQGFVPLPPTLQFTREEFPQMDGSTSLVPMAKAVAAALLGESEESAAELVSFNRTTQSFRNLMNGECGLLLVSEPNAAVFPEMEEAGFSVDMEQIAAEGLIFVVNENNPVENLTTEQLRGIYTGEITSWAEVGGEDQPIAAFQRNEGAGSQALMERMVMNGTPMQKAPAEYMATSMGELMESVKAYDNSANALGYSVYYYANDMKMAQGLKIIAVNGVLPSADTIRSGEYPLCSSYYCVIPSDEPEFSPARRMYSWMLSEEAQGLLYSLGYVSVMSFGAEQAHALVQEKYTRLSEEPIDNLRAGTYGALYPFAGGVLHNSYDGAAAYTTGYLYGFADQNGCIVADATYSSISGLTDMTTGEAMPFWIMGRVENPQLTDYGEYSWIDGDTVFAVAAADGSWVTDCEYRSIYGCGDVIIASRSYEELDFTVFDLAGNVLFTDRDLSFRSHIPYYFMPTYAYGVYMMQLSDSNGNTAEYLMNSERKLIAGPFAYVYATTAGTFVYEDQTTACAGVLRADGTPLIAAEYRGISCTDWGDYLCECWDGSNVILTADGQPRFSAAGRLYAQRYGYVVNDQNWNMVEFLDKDGGVLLGNADGRWSYSGLGTLFTCVSENSSGTTILDAVTGQTVTVDADYCYVLQDWFGADVLREVSMLSANRWDESRTRYYLVDEALNVLYDGYSYPSLEHDSITGRQYVVIHQEAGGSTVMCGDGSILMELAGSVELHNGCILEITDYASRLLTASGEELLCVSLISSADD